MKSRGQSVSKKRYGAPSIPASRSVPSDAVAGPPAAPGVGGERRPRRVDVQLHRPDRPGVGEDLRELDDVERRAGDVDEGAVGGDPDA